MAPQNLYKPKGGSKMSLWNKYLEYLKRWIELHEDDRLEGVGPLQYHPWLVKEAERRGGRILTPEEFNQRFAC